MYDSGDDADIITYTFANIPSATSEKSTPGPTYIYPHLLVLCKEAQTPAGKLTYFNTLADQYAWYHKLVLQNTEDNTMLGAKAKELVAGETNDFAKVQKVYN